MTTVLLLAPGARRAAIAQQKGKKQEFRATSPPWVMAGQTAAVKLYGENLNPAEIRFEQPGISAKVLKVGPFMGATDAEKRQGNTVVEVEVSSPAGAKPGLYTFTLSGDSVQPTTGRLLLDVPAPEIKEQEPNDTLYKPQVLPPGSVTVLGKLDNEGVDVFQIEGKVGEVWRFEVFARRLNPATKLEPVMRLRGPRREPLHVGVDHGQDCAFEYRLPADGPYTVELFDGDNKSGADFSYRLAIRKL